MKKFFLLLSLSLLLACSRNENACVVNGRYASAPDGTVLYVTPVDDILSPIDSAVVKGGKFSLELDGTAAEVCFLSSQKVLDGNYMVVEPGVVGVDFTGDVFAQGTPGNGRLARFMAEKEKLVNLRRMCEPSVMTMLGMDGVMCDSMRELAVMADAVFEAYALKEIRENINSPLGCFYIVQSVGVVTPAKLLPLIEKVPAEHRNRLYEAVKQRVKSDVENAAMAEKYIDDMSESLVATAVGKKFQNFELDDVAGGKLLLSDEVFANRYTLVFFWGSWHDGAKEQFAALSGALDKYRSSGLQMVGVSLDESVAACKAFVEELQVAWPQLCNPAGGSAEVAAAYGVTSLPAAVLINNRGTIIARMSTTLDVLKKFEELF